MGSCVKPHTVYNSTSSSGVSSARPVNYDAGRLLDKPTDAQLRLKMLGENNEYYITLRKTPTNQSSYMKIASNSHLKTTHQIQHSLVCKDKIKLYQSRLCQRYQVTLKQSSTEYKSMRVSLKSRSECSMSTIYDA